MTKSFKKSTLSKMANLPKFSVWAALVMSAALIGCNSNGAEPEKTEAVKTSSSKVVSLESDSKVLQALQTNLKKSGIEQTFTSAAPTDMPNIYWVTGEGMPGIFTDKTGKFVIQGQIVELGGEQPVDISAALLAKQAQQTLAAIDQDEMIIFPASGETKAFVYAFTDADCPYCTKLHSEMSEINRLGVEVRYLAWPRSEGSVPKMESIWCSSDRVMAMNKVKSGELLNSPSCENPVRDHIELGMLLGVTGTPAIFTEAGEQIGGYMPAKQLAEAAIVN